MRIAFDLDGTLADMQAVLSEAAERMFGKPPAATEREEPVDAAAGSTSEAVVAEVSGEQSAAAEVAPDDEPVPPAFQQLGHRQQQQLWRQVLQTENFWETLNETEPGIVARLAVIALEKRWEVMFITQRPSSAGDTCQLQTQRWLARHGFAMPSVYVIRGGVRGKLAAALDLDVVVDDRPDNCLDVVVESKARAFLVWRGELTAPAPVNARRLKIDVVQSVGECLDQLTAVEQEEKKATLMGRLRKFMGA